jgi:hypothetical protein
VEMTKQLIALLIVLSFCLFGCSTPTPSPASSPTTLGEPVATAAPATQSCLSPLVALQTGQDSSCGGGNIHLWPVAYGSEDCHGWTAVDTSGRVHENSANNIRCNGDGTFSFVQYAGTLTCAGGQAGVTKTYSPDICQQDIPPTLFTKAIDLTCCNAPGSSACTTGLPSVSVQNADSNIFLNGQVCSE